MEQTTTQDLERRAAALREQIETPDPKERARQELEAVERQMREQKEAAGREAAAKRMTGIVRAMTGTLGKVDHGARVQKAAQELVEAVQKMNDAYIDQASLAAEARALQARFGVPYPKLPDITPPILDARVVAALGSIPTPSDWARITPGTEEDAHRLRVRRTFREIAGTEAYRIISEAGLPDFPPLTEKQQAIVAARQLEQAEAEKVIGSVAAEVAVLTNPVLLNQGRGGDVRRG